MLSHEDEGITPDALVTECASATGYVGEHCEVFFLGPRGAAKSTYYLGAMTLARRDGNHVYFRHADHFGSTILTSVEAGLIGAISDCSTRTGVCFLEQALTWTHTLPR